jgi:DNA-binding LacI/PurR family transcriptional regulator
MGRSQWEKIAAVIREEITSGKLQPGARIPSEAQIAEQYEVSRPTAHRALNELQREGFLTRQRRWGTVVADRKAAVIPKTGRVAFLVDRFAQDVNFPQTDLIRGLHDGFGDDIDLVIAESRSDPEIEAKQIRKFASSVDGILLWPTTDPRNNPLLQRLFDDGFPIVVLDRFPADLHIDTVATDNFAATVKAIRTLEARGHRQIGFFSLYKPSFSSVAERHEAYVRALAEVGVDDTEMFTRWFPENSELNPNVFVQMVTDALFSLTHQQNAITALFCVEDTVAAAVLKGAERLGISIPDDLELATFNDWPPMMLHYPWSTHRIVQRSYDLGREAARMLLNRAQSGPGAPQVARVHADFLIADAGIQPSPPNLAGQ